MPQRVSRGVRGMKHIKTILHRYQQLLFLMLIIGATPSSVHAHGLEQIFPHTILAPFVLGLIAALICTFRHISIVRALLPSFGIYLVILTLGNFLIGLSEKSSWSAIATIVVVVVIFGILFGFISLVVGIFGMSLILNVIIKIIKALKKAGTP